MKITRIDCHVLLEPGYDIGATSSAQDDIVVEIHTDEGLTGIGESDVNPWIARACIVAPGTHTMGLGLAQMLIGADPLDVEALWEKLYVGSAMNAEPSFTRSERSTWRSTICGAKPSGSRATSCSVVPYGRP